MISLPPGESTRYFVSSVYAALAHLLAFGLLIRPALKLRSSNGRVGVVHVITGLAFVLAIRELVTAVGYVFFVITLVTSIQGRGTIRNYIIPTVAVLIAMTVRIYLREILFRTYRPGAVKEFLDHLHG